MSTRALGSPNEFRRVRSSESSTSPSSIQKLRSTITLIGRPFLHERRPVYWHRCALRALLHALCTPQPLWRKERPIPCPVCSRAHIRALMLQLSLGESFFFFFLLICPHGNACGNYRLITSGDLTDRLLFPDTNASHVGYGHFGTAYESLATPGNSSTYANPWVTVHADNHIFATSPFVNPNPSWSTESPFAAGAAYNDAIALPTVPNPYTWGPAPTQGPMDQYIGADFPDWQPAFPTMISSAAATTNGYGYQAHFPTNHGFDTQWTPVVDEFPRAFHAVNSYASPAFGMPQTAPPRPTCPTCTRSFSRQADLRRHAKMHQVGPKTFCCKVKDCGYGTHRKDKLGEHVRRRHPALGNGEATA